MTNEEIEQLRACIPTLASEFAAACYILAKETGAPDVEEQKAYFMEVAALISGAPPPMTDAALRIIASISGEAVADNLAITENDSVGAG